MTGSVNKGRAVNIVYLYFSKTFDTVSHNILIHKLMKSGIGKDSEVDGELAELITGSKSCSWGPVPSGAPQGLTLGPTMKMYNIFINDLDDKTECTSTGMQTTKPERVADTPRWVYWHSEAPQQAGETGRQDSYEVQEREVQSPEPEQK